MSGYFIISLDFELMWGVRDHRNINNYGNNILGVRKVIPKILDLFIRYNIHATWATVGLLFAKTRDEMLDFAPSLELRPKYKKIILSPYKAIEQEIGKNEKEDPYHFGKSLIDRIIETEGQEIGTHTYSHYYCLESGQSIEEFDADLKSAISIASNTGKKIYSIVFPRNQMSTQYIDIAALNNIKIYRGNPDSFLYKARSVTENNGIIRCLRLVDGILPLINNLDYEKKDKRNDIIDVKASRYLRPYNSRISDYSRLHIARIAKEMMCAAIRNRIYHLWWHPHNYGNNIEQNIYYLNEIIKIYQQLSDEYGMESYNMKDMADRCYNNNTQ